MSEAPGGPSLWMSRPVVSPGLSRPVTEAPQPAEPSYRSLLRGGSWPLLPLCALLLLGGSTVALGFGALGFGFPAFPQCSLWAGVLVIVLATAGLTARRRASLCLANVFFLLSVVCVPLNVAGFILCLDRGQHLSQMNTCYLSEKEDGCYCCSASRCGEKVQLAPARSCITLKDLHLQYLWFWLCAQHALASAVSFVAAVLRLRQIIISRPPSMDTPRTTAEDPESEAAPPSYSRATSSVPQLAHGAGDLCPLDPPPSYESVAETSTSASTQESIVSPSTSPSGASVPDCSIQTFQSTLVAYTQGQVMLRHGRNNSGTPHQPRAQPQPSSMVDQHSYRHIQQLVRKILEQPAALAPEVQELVHSIQNVLHTDREHMEEAVCCTSYVGQVVTEPEMSLIPATNAQQQPGDGSSHTFPRLLGSGDLSSLPCSARELLEHGGSQTQAVSRSGSRLDQANYPHSLIGVFRETML